MRGLTVRLLPAVLSIWFLTSAPSDSCYASDNHTVAFAQYALMRDSIKATGRPMIFNLCGKRFGQLLLVS